MITWLEYAFALLFAVLVGLLAAIATRTAESGVVVLFTLCAVGALLIAALAIFVAPHRR